MTENKHCQGSRSAQASHIERCLINIKYQSIKYKQAKAYVANDEVMRVNEKKKKSKAV